MIVADASAICDLLLATQRADAVAAALAADPDIHAPELLSAEVLSVLRRWVLRDWMTAERADLAVADFGSLPILLHGHAPLRERAWALRAVVSAYDGHYVALAEALEASLITTDVRLSRAATATVDVILAQ